jgi:hypothetical protein
LNRGAFNFKAAKEAAKAVVGQDGRIMSQSQAAAMERTLKDQGKNMTWVDITLGMTKKQFEEHDKELMATARREKELEHDYNFKEGHWNNPGKRRNNNGNAATLATRVSLGNTEYDIVDEDDASYLSNLAENLCKDNDHCKDMDNKMAAVHCDTGCALVPPEVGGKGTEPKTSANNNEEKEDQSDILYKHTGLQAETNNAQLSLPNSRRILQVQPFTPTRRSTPPMRGRLPALARGGLPQRANDMMGMVLCARGTEGRMLQSKGRNTHNK